MAHFIKPSQAQGECWEATCSGNMDSRVGFLQGPIADCSVSLWLDLEGTVSCGQLGRSWGKLGGSEKGGLHGPILPHCCGPVLWVELRSPKDMLKSYPVLLVNVPLFGNRFVADMIKVN